MTSEPRPVIWARLSGQGRGPARTLDYTSITTAAIAIADQEGLEAVSMRKIASRLEHSPMSLYRHIGGREDLIELMYDAVVGEIELPEAPRDDWRTELAGLARAQRALYHRHPWVSWLGQRPTLGPNGIRIFEYALASVDRLHLAINTMLDLVSTTQEFTQGFVQAELAEAQAQQRTGMDAEAWRAHLTPFLTQLLHSGKHPYLERLVRDAEDFPDPDVVFERRLDMVLDGLAANLSG